MSLNLVDLIQSQLGDQILGQISSAIGAGPAVARSAAGAAVPVLLAGLAGAAAEPARADALLSALNQPAPPTGGSLSTLLGNDLAAGLAGVLGRFTGLNAGATRGLLNTLTPVVLGTLGRQIGPAGLDAKGLARLLAGQKQNILNALPAGLGPLLGAVPGLGGSLNPATGPAGTTVTPRESTNTLSRLLLPLAIVVIAAIVLVQWRKKSAEAPASSAASQAAAVAAQPIEDAVDSVFSEAGVRLAKINNDAKTEAVELPRLQEINAKLMFIKQSYDSLSEPAKARVQAVANRQMNDFSLLANQVAQSPGSSPEFKNATAELLTKLKAFTH